MRTPVIGRVLGNVVLMGTSSSPRTLADQLRDWPDERLTVLLTERPDLAAPTPQDTAQLGSRAAVRSSLLRALELLDRTELAVLEALVALGPASLSDLHELVNARPERIDAAATRLTDLALIWGSEDQLRALTAAADGFAPGTPGSSGLRPIVSPIGVAPAEERLAELGPPARALLEHLDAHGGEGTTSGGEGTPVGDLLARHLVVPRPAGTVILPADVAVALRGGRTTREPVDQPPELAISERNLEVVDPAAAGAAFEAVRRTVLLLETWGSAPPTVLRTGGLGVRDLKAAAALLQVDEQEAALLVEIAAQAGLLGMTRSAGGDQVWAPTDLFDRWESEPVAEQWLLLAKAWLDSPRLVGLIGTKDRAGKTWNALIPELSGQYVVDTRRRALEVLAQLPPGNTLATGTGVPSLVDRLTWLRPRRPAIRAELTGWAITESALLGITGLGALSLPGRALLAGDDAQAVAALTPLLPRPVDQVLLQADLTAIAPGPLETAVGRRLHEVADIESRGGATVHRFNSASVRRALDGGWTARELHDFVGEVSRTPVPQALSYLIDDVARTHGSIRVGHAEAFLRADDEAALAALLHHPRAGDLELRRIAPTVVISTLPVDLLLPRLRELGSAPVLEAADGSVHVARPDVVRARGRRPAPEGVEAARRAAQVQQVITAVRAGDRAVASRPRRTTHLTPAETLARLRAAVEDQTPVWIGYVHNHGTSTERIVEPRRVDGGQLLAYDHRSEDSRGFAIHRITAVRPVE